MAKVGEEDGAVVGYHLPANGAVEQMQQCCGKRNRLLADSTLNHDDIQGGGEMPLIKCGPPIEQRGESN